MCSTRNMSDNPIVKNGDTKSDVYVNLTKIRLIFYTTAIVCLVISALLMMVGIVVNNPFLWRVFGASCVPLIISAIGSVIVTPLE